jgi:hypothetical protein
VLHDVFEKIHTQYDTDRCAWALACTLARARCADVLRVELRTDCELPMHLASGWDVQSWLEARDEAGKASKVLTKQEVSLLLQEWKQRPPQATAVKIRLAKRKAIRAIL